VLDHQLRNKKKNKKQKKTMGRFLKANHMPTTLRHGSNERKRQRKISQANT
jgi:hypothetical protein